jgi:hypothetical protein
MIMEMFCHFFPTTQHKEATMDVNRCINQVFGIIKQLELPFIKHGLYFGVTFPIELRMVLLGAVSWIFLALLLPFLDDGAMILTIFVEIFFVVVMNVIFRKLKKAILMYSKNNFGDSSLPLFLPESCFHLSLHNRRPSRKCPGCFSLLL